MAKSALEQQLAELEKLHKKGTVSDDEYQQRRTALMNAPLPVVAKGGRGGIFKWGMLGCLGIFAVIGILVIAAIVLVIAAVGSSGDKAADAGGDVHVPLAANSSGVISPEGNGSKKSKVTILQVADNATSTNAFEKPDPGKKYFAVEVEVENVGTKEVTSLDWKLRDSTDVETDRTFVSGVGDDLDIAGNLTPGGKKRGWVVFEIAAGASPKWVRADPNPFLAYDLYFDAP